MLGEIINVEDKLNKCGTPTATLHYASREGKQMNILHQSRK
jgi:hypothetical protein